MASAFNEMLGMLAPLRWPQALTFTEHRKPHGTLLEACGLKFNCPSRPVDSDLPNLRCVPLPLFLTALDGMNGERSKRRGGRRVVKRHAQSEDFSKRQECGNDSELVPRPTRKPLQYVIDVQHEFAGTMGSFNDLQSVDMIVMPGHFIEVLLCPDLSGRHFSCLTSKLTGASPAA